MSASRPINTVTRTIFVSEIVITFALMISAFATAAEQEVDFRRDIQPIFAEHCAKCHGVDVADRQADLRLDVREAALKGGESGEPAIVPGHADQSEIMARITSTDEDTIMPPPDEKNPLLPTQIKLIRRWIDQGAKYAAHWAFTAPKKTTLPTSAATHPIDRLVNATAKKMDLTLAPRADASTLCRRLYLDLIGLPPSPAELKSFKQNGYPFTLKTLLKSQRFGEKWARHWLDVARYSDTNGYEKDLRRNQWAWRDWVIDAMNRDLPYDQFIIEQIAGDLLPNPTPQQIIATGFLRNSMINEEGAIVPEQFRMVEMFDRMDCIGKAVLGLTTQCAQCHTHKFDPLTQDEYYGMFAFLNNSYEAMSPVYNTQQQHQIEQIRKQIHVLENQVREKHPKWQAEMNAWEKETRSQLAGWTPIDFFDLNSVSGLNHPTQLADKSILMLGHTSNDVFYIAMPDLMGVTGLRVEVLIHGDLPYWGPGRNATGSWDIQEIEVLVKAPTDQDWKKLKLVNATADFSQPEQKSEDGKKASGPVSFLIDGSNEKSWKADRGIGRRNQPSVAVMQFQKPLELPAKTQMKVVLRMESMVGCCRISTTKQPNPTALPVDYGAILAMQIPAARRSDADEGQLFTAWRKTLADCQELNQKITDQWNRFPQAMTTVLHLAEREADNRRQTHLLDRGEWDRPKHEVKPHTPSILHAMDEASRRDRLAFAKWLVSERSPLTARVAVNRIWQAIFGEGLVATPEDFGTRASVPEHLDLLDWLAVDFMEHDWSRKHLIRRIVTSATYQQSSQVPQSQYENDPKNRWLARGPRFRCEAEVIRDIALSNSGLITHQLGGPPVIPPVPQNVLDYNYVYPSFWKPHEGPERYRRTLYGFRKRSMPDPVMSNFDGPNGDISCARRIRSNTPLAALTGLNETIFVEAARAMALRILRESGDTDDKRADYAYQLCTSRSPTAAERKEILSFLRSQRKRLADGWLNPREIASGDAKKLPSIPQNVTPQDAAAWTLVSRVLLNLDETISKN